MSIIKKSKSKIRGIYKLLFIAIIGFYAYALYTYNNPSVVTDTVYSGIAEDSVKAQGILAFDEELIVAETEGEPQYMFYDGERITARQRSATLYNGQIDESTKKKLRELNDDIRRLELAKKEWKGTAQDAGSLSRTIERRAKEAVYYTAVKDFNKVYLAKNDIITCSEQLSSANNTSKQTSELDALKQQRNSIEASLSVSRKDYYCTTSGIFSSRVDGYEGLVDFEKIKNISVADLRALYNTKVEPSQEVLPSKPFAKIINNYEWLLVSELPSDQAGSLKAGDYVGIRINELSSDIHDARVVGISEEDGGKRAVVVSCKQYMENIYFNRKVSFDLIKRVCKGLKVQKAAIHEVDGKKGVYIIKENIIRFREIEPIYDSGAFVIVKEDNQNSKSLLLYDLVVIKGSNIQEGTIVRDIII